jgi:hypothetical protein
VALGQGCAATPEKLRDFVRARLAAYKCPRQDLARRRATKKRHREDHASIGGGAPSGARTLGAAVGAYPFW